VRVAFLAALLVGAAFAVPAAADDPPDTTVQFTLARVVHATPDAHRRIGIRVVCGERSGCKVAIAIARKGTPTPQVLGRVFTQLIGGSTETNYVILSKRTLSTLQRQRSMKVVVSAEVTDPAGNKATFTKDATLRPARTK
jgi:hypothetical protein